MDKSGKAYMDKAIVRSVGAPFVNQREAYIDNAIIRLCYKYIHMKSALTIARQTELIRDVGALGVGKRC